MITLNPSAVVADLVRERPSRSAIFERFGIDYCCGGNRSLTEACSLKGVEPGTVLEALAASDARTPGETPETWNSMTELAAHLEATHHVYLRENLPRLGKLTEKAAAAHGSEHPELVELRDLVSRFSVAIDQHLAKEEMVLFPMLRSMEAGGDDSHCGSVRNPIGVMFLEHEDAGAELHRMRELTGGFVAPEEACNTWRAMVDGLAELEKDMFRHVHLENNVLFPMAVEAEAWRA